MKNPNGFDPVFKLKGNRRKPWCARKASGWNDNGQPLYKYVGYYSTLQDAMIALAEYNRDPFETEALEVTLDELYEKWTDVHFEKVSRSNITRAKAAYKLSEYIKHMRVVDIRLEHLQRIVGTSSKTPPH